MAFSRAEEFDIESFLQSRTAKAIAHPARIVILNHLLKNGNTQFSEINHLLPLARTTVSFHMRMLLKSKLLVAFQEGEHTYYELDEAQCHTHFMPLGKLYQAFSYPK